MSQDVRDLRNTGLYLLILIVVAALLLACGALTSQRVGLHSAAQAVASLVTDEEPEPATKLSIAIENAREIRAALAKPVPGPDPLPPITAKLAHGHLKGGKAAARQHHAFRLPKDEAMDALASADVAVAPSRPPLPKVELHGVY